MAEPYDTLAEQLIDALGVEAADAAAVSAVLRGAAPEALAQLQESTRLLGLLGANGGLLFVDGPPENSFGSPGNVAIDLTNRVFYGRKDATTGWPAGAPFLAGREVELQTSATHIQWRYEGEATWTNLVALADITGPRGPAGVITDVTVSTGAAGSEAAVTLGGTPSAREIALTIPRGDAGREVQLQSTATHLQQRYEGETEWNDLLALGELEVVAGVLRWYADPDAEGVDLFDFNTLAGEDGWAPVPAVVVDGARRVLQIADWIGGSGAKPATGQYVGPTGFVSTAAAATDIRGAAGAGTGDMLGSNNLSDVVSVVAARTNLGVYSTAQVDTALAAKADLVGGVIPTSQMPALALTSVSEVGSQAAMLALSVQPGDVAIRTDENKSYILAAEPASTLSNWKLLRTPTDVVLSVAGETGTITAAALKSALALAVADVDGLGTALADLDARLDTLEAAPQSSGAPRFIASATASGSSVAFTDLLGANYILVVLDNVTVSANTGVQIQFSSDGGSAYGTARFLEGSTTSAARWARHQLFDVATSARAARIVTDPANPGQATVTDPGGAVSRNAILLTLALGATFTGGTITLFGC